MHVFLKTYVFEKRTCLKTYVFESCTHKDFWNNLNASDIHALYYGLSVDPCKVLSMLEVCPPANDLESRVADYLKIMIGNMKVNELSIFLRFVTGASVCIVPTIKVEFNGLSGLGRRPIAHTCDSILELPTSYINYEDFRAEFSNVLGMTSDSLYGWYLTLIVLSFY